MWTSFSLPQARTWGPLALAPKSETARDAASSDFFEAVRSNRRWLQEQLVEHGAVLFRGFLAGTAKDLESFAQAAGLNLMEMIRGNTPRSKVGGKVYTSTELPSFLPIPIHCEMSFVETYPAEIAFICDTPARHGGETPVADMQAVFASIPEPVRERFAIQGVTYIQTLPGKRGWKGTWQEMFATENRATVEETCAEQSIEPRWLASGALELRNTRPAVLEHPVNGRTGWFNHAHVFHPSFASELRRTGQPLKWIGAKTIEAIIGRKGVARILRHDIAYGDGTPIPSADIETVRAALWQAAVRFPWEKGDLILIDNLRIGHARMPFRGRRRILAAMVRSAEDAVTH